jgi:uncharacterized protein with HEPN domain
MPEIANISIIANKIDVLDRLGQYLLFSLQEAERHGVIGVDSKSLSLSGGNILAAFRMRFSEFQEQLGKLLRSIAIQEDIEIKGGASIAAFAERFEFMRESDWNRLREIRNSLNHDYDGDEVSRITIDMQQYVPVMMKSMEPVKVFCLVTYGIGGKPKTARPKG